MKQFTHLIVTLFCIGIACSNSTDSDKDKGDGNDTPTTLPKNSFVHITTNGKYTYIADSYNSIGDGETVEISKEYWICKFAVTNAEWEYAATYGRKFNATICIECNRKHPNTYVSFISG